MARRWSGGHTPAPANTDKTPYGDNNSLNDSREGGYPDYPVAGVVFPYRGQEQHGVAVTEPVWVPADVEAFDGEPEYVEHNDVHPVPVRIVSEFAREIRSWNATQTQADANPRELVGRNLQRTKVFLRNLSADTVVYIGRANGANYLSGFPVDPGQTLELTTSDEIHGVSGDVSKVCLIAVLQQFTVEGSPDNASGPH